MVWFKPWTWFSRNAQVVLANANTNVLKSALRNYIKAVNKLNKNKLTNQEVTKILNNVNATSNNKRKIRNRLANGVAKVLAASRRALPQAAAAVVTGAPEGPAAEAVNNAAAAVSNLTDLIPKPPAANRTALNAVLAKTTNQKLQSNINNRNKASALTAEVRNAAQAAGVNITNKNVNAALARIMNHESRLPVKAATTVTNRSRLNAALAKSQNQMLQGSVTNRGQANALMTEVRNAAQAAGVNLSNNNVSAALNRIMQHQSRLN